MGKGRGSATFRFFVEAVKHGLNIHLKKMIGGSAALSVTLAATFVFGAAQVFYSHPKLPTEQIQNQDQDQAVESSGRSPASISSVEELKPETKKNAAVKYASSASHNDHSDHYVPPQRSGSNYSSGEVTHPLSGNNFYRGNGYSNSFPNESVSAANKNVANALPSSGNTQLGGITSQAPPNPIYGVGTSVTQNPGTSTNTPQTENTGNTLSVVSDFGITSGGLVSSSSTALVQSSIGEPGDQAREVASTAVFIPGILGVFY
jgi:hypothetical protein